MKQRYLILLAGFLALGLVNACTKNGNPAHPTHDTTTVKNDTTHPAKPDTTVNLTKGLVLYLPFSGSIADSSGNGNPTALVGNTSLTYDEHGYSNNALGSDGSSQALIVTNNGSIRFDSAFTISLDFMQRSNIGFQSLISMVDPVTGLGPTFILGRTEMVSNFLFAVNDSLSGCDNIGNGSPYVNTDTTAFIPQLESWYNLVAIYHRGTVQLYVNGKFVSSKASNGHTALLCPNSKIVIGGWWNGQTEGLNGKIDAVRLYNRVINANEITQLSQHFQVTSTKVTPKLQ